MYLIFLHMLNKFHANMITFKGPTPIIAFGGKMKQLFFYWQQSFYPKLFFLFVNCYISSTLVVCILSSFQYVCTYCDFLCVQKYEVLVNYAQFLLTRALTSTLTRSSFCIVIERTLNSSQTLFKTKSFERKNFMKLHSKLRGWSLLSRNFILAPKS